MQNYPLVSVVITVYRIPREYLMDGISSVANQTYKNLEIIIVDDGSPDKCGEICDGIAENDERIKVIHTRNGGVSSARNIAIEAACGELVTFFDADDWLDKTAIETLVDSYVKTKSEFISYNHYYNYENDFEIDVPRASMPSDEYYFKNEEITSRLIYDMITPEFDVRHNNVNLGAVRAVWGKIYILDIIKKNNILFDMNLKIGEDACFNVEYLKYCKSALFINKYLQHYRVLENSANHKYRPDIIEVRVNLLNKYNVLFTYKDIDYCTCYAREVLSCIVNCLEKYISNKENNLTFRDRLSLIKNLIEQNEIKNALKENLDYDFFSFKEKILIKLIKNKQLFLLYLIGKI